MFENGPMDHLILSITEKALAADFGGFFILYQSTVFRDSFIHTEILNGSKDSSISTIIIQISFFNLKTISYILTCF